jgi:sigma-B regulation protein RsbU (phosphoserine phosphatase)
VVIADVSGKGIAAALLMAFVRPVIRAALDRAGNPAEALERTNRILVEERRTGLFVTVL